MSKKKSVALKRSAAYAAKIKVLRQYVAGFDAKAWKKLQAVKPRTPAGKAKRRAALAKVSRTYSKLKPYLQRSHKRVTSKKSATVRALADYANVPKLKGLRAVPMATAHPKKFKASVNKQGQVTVSRGKRYKEIIYKFPQRPRAHRVGKKFVTAGEHAIAMLEKMLPTMKAGLYVLQTRSQDLIPQSADRGSLLSELRRFVFAYGGANPEFMRYLSGYKWLAHSAEPAMKRQQELRDARTEFKRRQIDKRRDKAVREAKRLGKISKRARAKGRR